MQQPHTQSSDEVLASLEVDPDKGLRAGEAKRRRSEYGANRLRQAERRSALEILVDQFKSIIFALLFAAAALSFGFGEIVQGIAILVAILINVAIGFATELRATRSMEALRRLERMTATVRRDGEVSDIDAAQIVPGDMVVLEAGEMVPADLRLIEAEGLQLDESALTGESVPVAKSTDRLDEDRPVAERNNIAFKGTSVSAGSGLGVVVATGMDTELGHIAELAGQAEGEETPLEKRLDRLAQRLLIAIIIVAALVSVVGIFAGRDLVLMVETGVALIVAAVPEGLPIVASIALARGMWRLARRNALVEKLSAVETLGATNVICSDKTGTLTENRMTLGQLVVDGGTMTLDRQADEARFTQDSEAVDPNEVPALRAALEIAALCNDATLDEGDEDQRGSGDPMEVALLAGARAAGIERPDLVDRLPEVRRESFDPNVKMMATYHRSDDGVRIAIKGAPEAVLAAASQVLTADGETRSLDEGARKSWLSRNEHMARQGLRALALAQRSVPDEEQEPYEDLTLIGLVGLIDPPRSEVREAVLDCRRAGIRAVMVTGDQPSTARAIAEAVGLVDDGDEARVITGHDLSEWDSLDEGEQERLLETPIFARFDPKQKLDLIELYQNAGLVVAMTGDGVNDAPALKKADIGVAMGQRGTEVAREAGDMILRDDSFASIVQAIRQGRTIFANIRKFVIYMLSGNMAEIIAVSLVALLNAPLPLLPLQILYINIVSDVFPALALGVSRSMGDEMKRPPRDPGEPILTRRLWGAIGGYGVLIGASILAVFWAAFALGMSGGEAVTVSFLAFGFARLLHVFNMREAGSGLLRNEVTLNRWVWVAIALGAALMLAAAYLPVLSTVLQAQAPSLTGWGLIAAGSLAPLVIGQLIKLGRRGA